MSRTRTTSSKRRRADETDAERTARRAARRVELLDAAMAVIREEGPAASMERLAAGAGITKPIVYRHFGDRDGLVDAVAERFAAGVSAEVDRALHHAEDPQAILRSTIDAYLALVERDPDVYRFVVNRALGGQAGSEAIERIGGLMPEIAQRVAVVMGEQLRAAGHDSGAAEAWAYGIVGMVHLTGDWWLTRRTLPRAQVTDYLVTLLWDGLGHLTPLVAADPAPRGTSAS